MSKKLVKIIGLLLMVGLLFAALPKGQVEAATYTVNPGESIQVAIDGAGTGDTIILAAGTHTVSSTILVNKSVTITGPDVGVATVQGINNTIATIFEISVSNVTLNKLEITHSSIPVFGSIAWNELTFALVRVTNATALTNISLTNNKIFVPLQSGLMSTWSGVGVTVGSLAVASMTISGNEIYNTRNGIVVHYNNVLTLTANKIYNTKGGIMNYTGTQADANARVMTNNTWLPGHNEWDIVWNSGGGPYEMDMDLSVRLVSEANNGAYVLSKMTTMLDPINLVGNRSHIFVLAGSSYTTKNWGVGNFNQPFATVSLGVEAVVPGGTVYVAAGTYVERLIVDKSLNLYGAQYGIDPTGTGARIDPNGESIITEAGLSTPNPDVLIEIPLGVQNVKIDGFTLNGDQTNTTADSSVLRIWDDNISITNNIIDGVYGVIFKGNDTLLVDNNRIIANKAGVVSQPSVATYVTVSDNTIDLGTTPQSDPSGINYTNCSHCIVEGNTITGFNNSGAGRAFVASGGTYLDILDNIMTSNNDGLSIYGGTTFINIARNVINNNARYGINIKGADINILNNIISNSGDKGINIDRHVIDTQRVMISNNSISGSTNQEILVTAAVTDFVNASGNWFGVATPDEVKAEISGNVDYTPWIAVGTDISTDPGFQGDFSTLWVDDDSLQTGTVGRIQEGVNLVSGSTVNVAAGTYVENVVVNKQVEIAGAGQTSTFVIPAISNPTGGAGSIYPGASNVFLVQASNVKIHDLTVDGDNPALTSLYNVGGANLDARNGIITDHTLEQTFINLEVYNTTVKNIYLRGIYASTNGGTFNFHHNNVTNVQAEYASIAIFAYYGPGTISNNTVSYANDAISANHSKGIQFLNNTVTYSGSGIHTDNSNDSGGVADLIQGNSVDCTGTPNAYGIWTFVPYVAPTVNNNTITNCPVGLSAWGQGAAIIHQYTNNIVTGDLSAGSVGVYVTTDLISWGYTDVSVNFTGNTITGHETAIAFVADEQSWNPEDPFVPQTINATFHQNKIYGNTVDVTKDSGGLAYNIDVTMNWWGSACGPTSIPAAIPYSPWYTDASMTATGEGELGAFVFPTGSTTASMNAIIACAAPGSTLTFEDPAYAYPGGLIVGPDKYDLTFELNGVTVGAGSPAFDIFGDDIAIQGPGILDGDGSTDPGIRINDGADNPMIEEIYIEGWQNGIEVSGSHASFKVVSSWIHDNTAAGMLFNEGVTFATNSVVTIEGNLFKANGGPGINNLSTTSIPAAYNSWGDIGGPTTGDEVSGPVVTSPFTYSEIFVDMVNSTIDTEIEVGMTEQSTFSVAVKVDAVNLYAVSYELHYNPAYLDFIDYDEGPNFDSTSNAFCDYDIDEIAGSINLFCVKTYGDEVTNVNGETISILEFKATGTGLLSNGPWMTYFDITTDEEDLSSGAIGGVKVFVNNGGFGEPSTEAGHTITDTDDGKVIITGLANYTGYIDLEGRPNDSGAVISVYSIADKATAVEMAEGTSASSGKYTTAFLSTHQLTIGSTYYLNVDAYLYLPTTIATATEYEDSAALNTRSLTSLATVLLLGGDSTNDDLIDITDVSCIGGDYNLAPDICGTNGFSDVNGDGVVDIYDLVLSGGNVYKAQSIWVAQ